MRDTSVRRLDVRSLLVRFVFQVRTAFEEPGEGRVLVVDAGGSMRCAMLGDNIAESGEISRSDNIQSLKIHLKVCLIFIL